MQQTTFDNWSNLWAAQQATRPHLIGHADLDDFCWQISTRSCCLLLFLPKAPLCVLIVPYSLALFTWLDLPCLHCLTRECGLVKNGSHFATLTPHPAAGHPHSPPGHHSRLVSGLFEKFDEINRQLISSIWPIWTGKDAMNAELWLWRGAGKSRGVSQAKSHLLRLLESH